MDSFSAKTREVAGTRLISRRGSGGEGGIRYVTASMPSATYRFYIAAPTVDASVAMAPCPILPDRN